MIPGADLRRDVHEEDGRAMARVSGGAGGAGRREGQRGRGEGGNFFGMAEVVRDFRACSKESQESGVSETSHGVM